MASGSARPKAARHTRLCTGRSSRGRACRRAVLWGRRGSHETRRQSELAEPPRWVPLGPRAVPASSQIVVEKFCLGDLHPLAPLSPGPALKNIAGWTLNHSS